MVRRAYTILGAVEPGRSSVSAVRAARAASVQHEAGSSRRCRARRAQPSGSATPKVRAGRCQDHPRAPPRGVCGRPCSRTCSRGHEPGTVAIVLPAAPRQAPTRTLFEIHGSANVDPRRTGPACQHVVRLLTGRGATPHRPHSVRDHFETFRAHAASGRTVHALRAWRCRARGPATMPLQNGSAVDRGKPPPTTAPPASRDCGQSPLDPKVPSSEFRRESCATSSP